MTDTDSNVIQFPSKEELAKRLEGIEMTEWIFTNDKENPYPQAILHAFYDGIVKNKVGIMHAKLADKDEVHTLLVGIEVTEGGDVGCYPLARILTQEEQAQYIAPDGEGGWQDGSN